MGSGGFGYIHAVYWCGSRTVGYLVGVHDMVHGTIQGIRSRALDTQYMVQGTTTMCTIHSMVHSTIQGIRSRALDTQYMVHGTTTMCTIHDMAHGTIKVHGTIQGITVQIL